MEANNSILAGYVEDEDFGKQIKVTKKTLWNWRASRPRKGPRPYKIAGRIYYKREDIERWIADQAR